MLWYGPCPARGSILIAVAGAGQKKNTSWEGEKGRPVLQLDPRTKNEAAAEGSQDANPVICSSSLALTAISL